ncbi:hypothetical protein, partial [Mangrovihabitans endophyticus]|uniref:hypothetical protein n=1 Tax=Mangrovihabitans endophyticus TaxID=1751298 RepID=UPI001662E550
STVAAFVFSPPDTRPAKVNIPGWSTSPASAASAFDSRDNWDRSGECDAILGVSDETSDGEVEVFGGFSCPDPPGGLWNSPEPTTIRVRLFRNGSEIIQSKKSEKTCKNVGGVAMTCRTDSHSVSYPDYSSSDSFYGKMEIVSFGGTVTLTTGSIVS